VVDEHHQARFPVVRPYPSVLEERPDLWNDMGVPSGWQGFKLWREATK
jgi:hypothetical protein